MELIKKQLGNEGEYVVEIVAGKLKLKLIHNHASGAASLEVVEDAGYFFDKLAAAVPGVLDDAFLALLKEAVKKI